VRRRGRRHYPHPQQGLEALDLAEQAGQRISRELSDGALELG